MKVQETGFVEFVTKLIGETMDAIISSQLEQSKRTLDLEQDLYLTNEQFIFKYNLITMAKEVLGDEYSKEKADLYIEEYIENHKSMLQRYFDNNNLNILVDRAKVSAKMIFSLASSASDADETIKQSNPEIKKDKKSDPLKSKTEKPLENLKNTNQLRRPISSPEQRKTQLKIEESLLANKNLIVRGPASIGSKITVQPVDLANKDVVDLKTDIVSSVEISLKTTM